MNDRKHVLPGETRSSVVIGQQVGTHVALDAVRAARRYLAESCEAALDRMDGDVKKILKAISAVIHSNMKSTCRR